MLGKRLAAASLSAAVGLSIAMVPNVPAYAASASSLVTQAKKIAADNSHGYSMTNRWGPDYDCSSFIITALKKAGFDTNGASYTGDMVSCLTGAGFTYYSASSSSIDFSSPSTLKAGDIMIKSGHAEIYAGNSQRIGAHSDYDGKTGDSSGKEICVSSYYNGGWAGVLRYTGSTSSTTSTTNSSTSYTTGTYKTTLNLNMRKSASINSKVLTCIPYGTKVKIKKISGSWGKTSYKGTKGWVALKYLKKTSSSKSAVVTYKKGTYKTTLNLNMRKSASINSKVLTCIPYGTKVKIKKISGSWGKTSYKGTKGWVALKYLTK